MDSESTFDVDAWLDQAAPPTRSVTVYGRGDLVARLQDLAAADQDQPGDFRLAGPAGSAESADLQRQIEESALTLHVRGLLDVEQRDLLEQAKAPAADQESTAPIDEARYEQLLLSASAVRPPLTVEQAGLLRARVGQAQWDAIFHAVSAASKETIDVPLSLLGSGTTPGS